MIFSYTAKDIFDKTYPKEGQDWESYTECAKFTHLKEIISLDGLLNAGLVEPLYYSEGEWDNFYFYKEKLTCYYLSVDYVLKRMEAREKFHLISLVIEPEHDCRIINKEGYEFVGYDIMDKDFCNSAITNCFGFNESFLPTDLNEYGLIDDFDKANYIKIKLLENNPGEDHMDTYVIAIWRHTTIGRSKTKF